MGVPAEKSPYQLLVEGDDDMHSVIHLMRRHGYDWDDKAVVRPHIRAAGGVTPLLDFDIPKALSATYERVGFLIDADDTPVNRWAALRERSRRAGVTRPDTPNSDGTIVEGGRPKTRVGVWLMPDNRLPGSLEDFLAKLIPAGDACWERARAVVAEAGAAGCAQNISRLKHELHTWLAWHPEKPGMPFGQALTAKAFAADTPEALAFVAWFRRMFVEP